MTFRLFLLVWPFLLGTGISFSQGTIDLFGRVFERDSSAFVGAEAKITTNGLVDTTEAAGTYNLQHQDSVSVLKRISQFTRFNAGVLNFQIINSQPVNIQIFDLRGRWLKNVLNRSMDAGGYSLQPFTNLNVKSNSLLILNVNIGNQSSNFKYVYQGEQPGEIVSLNQSEPSGLFKRAVAADTVTICVENQVVKKYEIDVFVDTLPDLYIGRITISGGFTDQGEVGTIVANVQENDTSEVKKVTLTYIDSTNSYTGTLYQPLETGDNDIKVVIDVLNSKGGLASRIDTMTVDVGQTSVTAPDASLNTARPTADAGKDTTMSINDVLLRAGIGSDALGGSIIGWEWDLGGTGNFQFSSDGQVLFQLPSTANAAYPIILKVVDNDSNITLDTAMINIEQDPPVPVTSATPDTISPNDSVRVWGSGTDVYGGIVYREWDFGNTGVFYRISGFDTTIAGPSSANPAYEYVLRITDDDSNKVLDTLIVTVVQDPPTANANAAKDTLSINDTVNVNAIGSSDVYGSIVKWEWDVGNTGSFIEVSSGSDTGVALPSSENVSYSIVLRVTDDDGNAVMDTLTIAVLQDAPTARVNTFRDTVSIGDTITLSGANSTDAGTIVKWEWDIGNTGGFVETSTSDTVFAVPGSETLQYQSVLRVTDEDGNSSMDTITMTVLADIPIAQAQSLDSSIVVKNAIQLKGGAINPLDSIVKWEWDFGNTGSFYQTSTSDTTVAAPSATTSNYEIVLRVTDEDSHVSLDTLTIDVIASDGSWAQACVDRVNGFRSTVNLIPLVRETSNESCTDTQSKDDSEVGTAHANFGDCNESAQNECPDWPDRTTIIDSCMQMMWDEEMGPPGCVDDPACFALHGHRINMEGDYTSLACGFYETPAIKWWHIHNFK